MRRHVLGAAVFIAAGAAIGVAFHALCTNLRTLDSSASGAVSKDSTTAPAKNRVAAPIGDRSNAEAERTALPASEVSESKGQADSDAVSRSLVEASAPPLDSGAIEDGQGEHPRTLSPEQRAAMKQIEKSMDVEIAKVQTEIVATRTAIVDRKIAAGDYENVVQGVARAQTPGEILVYRGDRGKGSIAIRIKIADEPGLADLLAVRDALEKEKSRKLAEIRR